MTVIYFSGIDGSGKSTLINSVFSHFSSKNSIYYYKNGLYPSEAIAYINYWKQITQDTNTDIVLLDRSFLDEEIYGKVYRGKTQYCDDFTSINECFIQQNAILVWCNPPYEISYNNWSGRLDEEAFKDKDKYTELWEEHQKLRNMTTLPIIEYDYTKGEFDFDLLN